VRQHQPGSGGVRLVVPGSRDRGQLGLAAEHNVPEYAWGFAPPGAADSTAFGFPGANGNYLNGFSSSLLGHSAYCLKGVNQDKSHGIVSHCE
jgi:hypothetical protein